MMATKATMKLDISAYLEQIAAIGAGVDAAADEALEAGAEVALAGMVRRVPVDSGNLQASLKASEAQADGNYHFIEVGLIDADAETAIYGNVQEFGSSSVQAQPYVRPTMAEDKGKISGAERKALSGFLAAKEFSG